MTANDIRTKYLEFFTDKIRRHKSIPPAPLVPREDPTTLFTSSGMQQLVPYLKGEPHPMGKRLVDSQPCFRAEDIEEIGDNRHTTFFEMLGNWSLGDYFKKDQLHWFYEFLTQEVGLNSQKLHITVFEGSDQVNKDEASIKIWQEIFETKKPAKEGIKGFDPKTKIYTYSAKENWWSRSGEPKNMPAGEIGGPDSEVFYDFGEESQLHEKSPLKDKPCHLNCNCGRFLEIGNSVFMQYEKQKDGSFKSLPQKNVDFGGGLERIAAASQNQPDIFQIDLIKPIIKETEQTSDIKYLPQNQPAMRVIADHLRAATFMIAEGVEPINKLQGYILRRLLRRAAVKMHQLKGGLTPIPGFTTICRQVIRSYQGIYFNDEQFKDRIPQVIDQEMAKFAKTLDRGLRQINKTPPEKVNGKFAFDLFQTYGFPFEISKEILSQKGINISKKQFDLQFEKHQQLSRQASAGVFKGGLADRSKDTTKLHTTTHLLHQALREILGDHVRQEGSHVTSERLRFDFYSPEKLSTDQTKKVENLINQKIKQNLPVNKTIEDKDTALKSGALAFFKETYPEKVSVYTIGEDVKKDWFSKELCGGPHVTSTGQIGGVTIKKAKSIGANVSRLYLVLKTVHGVNESVRKN